MTFFSLLQKFLQLDSYEISEGKALKVNVSEPKTRLFLGNIPKLKGKDEIEEEFTKLTGKRKLKFLISSKWEIFFKCVIQNWKVIRQFFYAMCDADFYHEFLAEWLWAAEREKNWCYHIFQ